MSGIQCVKLWHPGPAANISCAAEDAFVSEVPEPELHIFPADENRNTGLGAVICPGGGYGGLSMGPEGHSCAAWLASVGITGMVLKYRLPGGNKAIPLEDMRRAMHFARAHAEEIGFLPGKLGVIGFSAGGHLASMASTVFAEDPAGARPDFCVLFYPVISLDEQDQGLTSRNLLGNNPSKEEREDCSANLRVNGATPPTLLFLCDDDHRVPPRQSLLYYDALKSRGIPASMHIFPHGGHAWGFRGMNTEGERFRYGDLVKALLFDWLLLTSGGETPFS